MTDASTRREILDQLSAQMRRMQCAKGGDSLRSPGEEDARSEQTTLVSTGIEPLDGLLPEGGFRWGTMVEWLAEGEGCGAMTLALVSARSLLREKEGALVIVDRRQDFYPPAAAGMGIDLERVVIVRPTTAEDELWALEQSLRSPGVAVTFCELARLDDRAFRRLQLAAETGGGLGMLERPAAARREPSWAEVRLGVLPICDLRFAIGKQEAAPSEGLSEQHGWRGLRLCEGPGPDGVRNARRGHPPSGPDPATPSQSQIANRKSQMPILDGRRFRIELLRCRNGTSGGAVDVELNHETGLVHLVSKLAAAASARRTAGP